ncbi:hypothetical protein F5I97DRAFT_1798685 [Phlebopus sp. FC_14]|nr:hypothetical protein F5I97DRAFT_1798685 [Phlebopus sp. FC_14]
MPPKSSLSADEKTKLNSAIASSDKRFGAALARIYFAHPQPDKWSYGGLQGALALIDDRSKDALVLKLVDIEGTRGVLWEHELYEGFEYFEDRPHFHSFPGDECMIGVVFANKDDARKFYNSVTGKASKAMAEKRKKNKAKNGGKVDKSMISGPQPGSFKHVGHIGFDEEKGLVSSNVDPSWITLINDLASHGVSNELIEENKEFIKRFILNAQNGNAVEDATAKKKPPPPPAPRRAHAPSDNAPPPPPPPPLPPSGGGGPVTGMPPPQAGRADLMASIRGQGVHNLRKTPAPSSSPAPPPAAEESGSSSAGTGNAIGGDLTAALAAALLQRSKKLGDSDEEDDDDDEWD